MRQRVAICWSIVASVVATNFTAMVRAEPAYVTGSDLLKQCTTETADSVRACYGYILGVADAYTDPLLDEKVQRLKVCIPAGTPVGKVADPVVAYLKAPGTDRETKASRLVAVVLSVHFRCR